MGYGVALSDCSIRLLAALSTLPAPRPSVAAPRRRLVELLEADGLIIDLNPVQEQVRPEGRRSRGRGPGGGHRDDRDCRAPVPVVVDGDRLRHA
jgi:hypothetical protein